MHVHVHVHYHALNSKGIPKNVVHRPDAGVAEACELAWGAAQSSAAVTALAAKRLDLVIAADACYDDQVACCCCTRRSACALGHCLAWSNASRWASARCTVAGWQDARPRGLLHHLQRAVFTWQDENIAGTRAAGRGNICSIPGVRTPPLCTGKLNPNSCTLISHSFTNRMHMPTTFNSSCLFPGEVATAPTSGGVPWCNAYTSVRAHSRVDVRDNIPWRG
jgi:hypothetical protein